MSILLAGAVSSARMDDSANEGDSTQWRGFLGAVKGVGVQCS